MEKIVTILIIAVILICWLGFHIHFFISFIIGIISIPVLTGLVGSILEEEDKKRRKNNL